VQQRLEKGEFKKRPHQQGVDGERQAEPQEAIGDEAGGTLSRQRVLGQQTEIRKNSPIGKSAPRLMTKTTKIVSTTGESESDGEVRSAGTPGRGLGHIGIVGGLRRPCESRSPAAAGTPSDLPRTVPKGPFGLTRSRADAHRFPTEQEAFPPMYRVGQLADPT